MPTGHALRWPVARTTPSSVPGTPHVYAGTGHMPSPETPSTQGDFERVSSDPGVEVLALGLTGGGGAAVGQQSGLRRQGQEVLPDRRQLRRVIDVGVTDHAGFTVADHITGEDHTEAADVVADASG